MMWPKLKRDYKGLTVRTKVPISNGFMKIPENTVCTVTEGRSNWVNLSSEPCPHCGVSIYIRKVHRYEVELIQQADKSNLTPENSVTIGQKSYV
jgi:hypothetical protein